MTAGTKPSTSTLSYDSRLLNVISLVNGGTASIDKRCVYELLKCNAFPWKFHLVPRNINSFNLPKIYAILQT